MGKTKLKDIVTLSTGFKTAVNLQNDLDNLEKAGGYLPTEVGHRVIFDVSDNLHPRAARRARLVMGTYGTGKSHLALVLINFYRQRHKDPSLSPLWERLSAQWPGQSKKLGEELNRLPGAYLPVLLEGDEGDFNDALLRALKKALRSGERTAGVLPDTAFAAAVRRIDQLKSDYPESYKALDNELRGRGQHGAEVIRERLNDFDREAYERFREAHRAACAGAEFHPEQMMRPSEVYQAVSRQLVKEGLAAGIVVFWDEFGRYMERIADDPTGGESRDIERFAETCQTPENNLHLYLICHRSLEEYAHISRLRRGVGDERQLAEDMRKAMGRFSPFIMRSSDEEVFQLIDQVVIQSKDNEDWRHLLGDRREDFDRLAETAVNFGLFPGFPLEQVRRVVAQGSFPLHPAAAFCLPRLSEMVAQNERTLFTYLSDSGYRTMGEFVAKRCVPDPEEPLPLATVVDLWDYFEEQIANEERTKRTYQLYQSSLSRVPAGSKHGTDVLKAVGVFEAIQTDRVRPTLEMLAFALNVPPRKMKSFREDVDALASGDGRILARSVADGSYRFARAGAESLEEKMRSLVEQRASITNPIRYLNEIWAELGLPDSIPASAYTDERYVPRMLRVEAVGASELQNLTRWTRNLGAGEFADGYALLVVAEDSRQLQEGTRLAREVDHPQIAIGITKQPLPRCLGNLRRHEALAYLEKAEAHLYGEGAELREEWEATWAEYRELLVQTFRLLLEGQQGRLESVSWFWQGQEQEGITSESRLKGLASRVMEMVFSHTPVIRHDVLADERQRDTFRKHRVPVLDLLLQQDGPDLLARDTVKPQKHVIDALLRNNGVLRTDGVRYAIGRPEEGEFPAMAAVWDEAAAFVERSRESPQQLLQLVTDLRKPPYGLPVRCMPIIFAAVGRERLMLGNLIFEQRRTQTTVERITKVTGEAIEAAFASPDQYRVAYLDVSQQQRLLLEGLAQGMGFDVPQTVEIAEMLRRLGESAGRWWMELPGHAQLTQKISKEASLLKRDIFAPLSHPQGDPHRVLLEVLPTILRPAEDEREISSEEVAELFGRVRAEFEITVDRLREEIGRVIVETFVPDSRSGVSPADALSDWYGRLEGWKRTYRFTGDAGKLTTVASSPGQDAVAQLADSLMGLAIPGWADDLVNQFKGRLQSAKGHVEAFVLPEPAPGPGIEPRPVPPKHMRVILLTEEEKYEKLFSLATDLTQNGRHLENLLLSAVRGIGATLPDGECVTIVVRVLREALDAH